MGAAHPQMCVSPKGVEGESRRSRIAPHKQSLERSGAKLYACIFFTDGVTIYSNKGHNALALGHEVAYMPSVNNGPKGTGDLDERGTSEYKSSRGNGR